MIFFIDSFIKVLIYTGFLIGAWFIASPFIVPSMRNSIQLTRFRKEIKKDIFKKPKKNKLFRHIEKTLNITKKNTDINTVYSFFIISFSLFFVVFIVLIKQRMGYFSLIFALIAGLSPYLINYLKLSNIRLQSSYEGEVLITELTNQYKINNYNMIDAIDKSMPFLNNNKYTKQCLFKLSMAVKEYKYDNDLDDAIDEFVFSINTEWAVLLGINIFLAISDGSNVSGSLDDIINDLKMIKESIEKGNRENSETFALTNFIPFIYIGSVWLAVKYFNFTPQKFLDYQLRTSIGLKFGLLILTLCITNIAVSSLMKKPKFDL